MPSFPTPYRGRFAPSPTGPLHLGSLIAALASYLDARHNGGAWLVRMEDLDPPREEPGAADSILHSLQCHGLHWDEDVLYQSTRSNAYADALAVLTEAGLLFSCDCTRAMLDSEGNCRRNCRERQQDISGARAIRISIPPDCEIQFPDLLQGPQHLVQGHALSDFVVRRKDGLDAYQLAVVVDDAAQGITHVVRGSDLLDPTVRQVFLQQSLDYPTPQYCHVPVVTDSEGHKLSKQTFAPALEDDKATDNLRCALQFLGQPAPPTSLTQVEKLLSYATEHWSLQRVPAELAIAANNIGLI